MARLACGGRIFSHGASVWSAPQCIACWISSCPTGLSSLISDRRWPLVQHGMSPPAAALPSGSPVTVLEAKPRETVTRCARTDDGGICTHLAPQVSDHLRNGARRGSVLGRDVAVQVDYDPSPSRMAERVASPWRGGHRDEMVTPG